MAQLVVRHLEENVKSRLQRRAIRNGRSTEEEVCDILRNAVRDEDRHTVPLGSRLRERFAGTGLEKEIPQVRRHRPRAASFKR